MTAGVDRKERNSLNKSKKRQSVWAAALVSPSEPMFFFSFIKNWKTVKLFIVLIDLLMSVGIIVPGAVIG